MTEREREKERERGREGERERERERERARAREREREREGARNVGWLRCGRRSEASAKRELRKRSWKSI